MVVSNNVHGAKARVRRLPVAILNALSDSQVKTIPDQLISATEAYI